MRATRRSVVFYFLINIVLYILLTGFLLYFEKQTEYDLLSNQLYYDNILLIYNGGNIDWADAGDSEEYRVYAEVSQNCRALIKDTSKWTPPMLTGYYPGEETGAAAVIGQNVEKSIFPADNGVQWIRLIGQEFRVTGVVGAEYATSCDDLILLFGARFEESDLDHMIYIVDVKTQTGAQKIARSLTAGYPEIQIQPGAIRGTARLTKSSYFYRLLMIELLFITVFSVYISGRFRHEKYDMNYKVYQICGLPLIFILIRAELEVLVINSISLSIVSGVGYFGGLLTRSQLENVVWISIGITTLSAILEAGFFGHQLRKLNACDRRLRRCGAKKIRSERL